MRELAAKTVKCAMCEQPVELNTMDSPHPEAPTLVRPAHSAVQAPWFGFLSEGTFCLLVLCSEACAQKMLEE